MGDVTTPIPMVRVVNAHKSFDQSVILNDLSMTVPAGKTYALLGPSGSGKTVLLNCILGFRTLDDGYIKLGIKKKTDIGYMPQDVGLSLEFTLRETLTFYGQMYGIGRKALTRKVDELANVFELPDLNLRINELSGGEQRRVSLAVAMLHDAKLLLLDEPTAGVDPLLSKTIWEFLRQETTNGKTVIITTHYIEEARMAHTVGIMRGGVLLIEDSPQNVMSSQNAESLEIAFLQLSKQQQTNLQERKIIPFERRRRKSRPEDIFEPGGLLTWNRFYAHLVKNLINLRRNSV